MRGTSAVAGRAVGSPMGLSKSKLKPKSRKGEERKGTLHSAPKGKVMETSSQEVSPAETARPRQASGPREEKADVKQKLKKKKFVIPQIIITKPSDESLVSCTSTQSEEQRTIRERADWGPYFQHRSPSTVAAYDLPKNNQAHTAAPVPH